MGKKKGKKSVTIKMDWNEFAQMSGSGVSELPVAPSQSTQSAQSSQSGDRAWGRCRQGSGHNDSRASVPESQYPMSYFSMSSSVISRLYK